MTIFIPAWLVATVTYIGLGIVALGLLWAAFEVAMKVVDKALVFTKAARAYVRFAHLGRGPLMELDKVHEEIDRLSTRINELEKWRWDVVMRLEERDQSA